MIDPTDNFDDELLSAYVDGELTGEQLALVEQRLTDDPRAKQLVQELRALRQEVQSLPKETLGEDLRATIMQRAERSMLLGAEQQPSRGAEQKKTSRPSNFASSRRWVWAATALAATLLLMVLTPNNQQQENPQASAKPSPTPPHLGELASAGGGTPKHPKPEAALADAVITPQKKKQQHFDHERPALQAARHHQQWLSKRWRKCRQATSNPPSRCTSHSTKAPIDSRISTSC